MLKELNDINEVKNKKIKNIEINNGRLFLVFNDSFILFEGKIIYDNTTEIEQEKFDIYDYDYEVMINMGIYTKEEYDKLKKERELQYDRLRKEREYELYRELKNKFEN